MYNYIYLYFFHTPIQFQFNFQMLHIYIYIYTHMLFYTIKQSASTFQSFKIREQILFNYTWVNLNFLSLESGMIISVGSPLFEVSVL